MISIFLFCLNFSLFWAQKTLFDDPEFMKARDFSLECSGYYVDGNIDGQRDESISWVSNVIPLYYIIF
jgi:hypothetical protein